MKSNFQRVVSMELIALFYKTANIIFREEQVCGCNGQRIDLGTDDGRFGIEIKSNTVDLKSGCGLNQEKYTFGYVCAPLKIAHQVIGYLYMKGMENTGVIAIDNDGDYTLIKGASPNKGLPCDYFITNQIERVFFDNGAIYNRNTGTWGYIEISDIC